MAMKYLLDSNIVIYFLGGFELSIAAIERIDRICKDGQRISVISKLELLGFNFSSPTNEKETKQFVDNSHIYPLNSEIENETIRIRKSVKVKLADAIIAATCVVNDFTLLTRNKIDFSHIQSLKIENPFDW